MNEDASFSSSRREWSSANCRRGEKRHGYVTSFIAVNNCGNLSDAAAGEDVFVVTDLVADADEMTVEAEKGEKI